MPVLGTLFTFLFGGIAAFFVEFLTKKVVVVGLAVAGCALALVALMLVFNNVVAPLVAQMFSTQYGQFLGLAFPPIAGTCMAGIASTWGACALYKLKLQSIKMSASA